MGARQKEWARRVRADWTLALGHQCARCRTYEDLSFDVVIPCDGGKHHRQPPASRITFYRAQLKALNIQLLCERCNSSKGDDHTDYRTPEDMEKARALAETIVIRPPKNPF